MSEFAEHLEVHRTDRGFRHLPPITDTYGDVVRTYESSAAGRPCVWLSTVDPDGTSVVAHLTAHDAWRLSEQLQFLVREHYQGDARPEWAFPDAGYRDAEGRPTGASCEGE